MNLEIFHDKKGRMLSPNNIAIICNKNPELKNWLENRYPDSESFSETIFRIKNGIDRRPVCKICGKKLIYKRGFNTYCSSTCQNNDPDKQEKTKKTKKERYGDENYNNVSKAKQTCLDKYGVESYCSTQDFIEKTKKTNLERYGVEWGLSLETTKEKTRKTKKERYGDENYNNRELAEKTTFQRYGVRNTKQSEIAKEKEKNTCLKKYGVTSYRQTNECNEKIKQTTLERYGVEHITQSEDWKNTWYGNKEWVAKRSENIYKTMKKNNSFSQSKQENELYENLCFYFKNIIREYKDPRYPFKCDFYIPEKDTFVEFNGHWTHGGHPFNPDDANDMAKLELWKNKNGKFYNNAIHTWTESDVLKQAQAKKMQLNYIMIYPENLKCLEEIINKIMSFSISPAAGTIND